MAKKKNVKKLELTSDHKNYKNLISGISDVLESARHASAYSVNLILTAAYWEIGRRIVEFEQKGKVTAEYGEQLIIQLAKDLTGRFGRGFSRSNLFQMRLF
ncbi:MAG: DUF1016 N-terminal domain-containing protein, partial [Candidatus Omnitrophica bacterium]|nr:DUF1016 N-terminal domain-containing protein [Candidatus Omnitrophota bacterium]